MPEALPAEPRYQLLANDTSVRPQRWVYAWVHERSGITAPCHAFYDGCTAKGCPGRKAAR